MRLEAEMGRALRTMEIPRPAVSKRDEPVEKVVVGPVGSPKHPKAQAENTIVHTDTAPEGLSWGDTVWVTGTVKGARSGENAFGGTVKAVEVQADSVELTKSSAR